MIERTDEEVLAEAHAALMAGSTTCGTLYVSEGLSVGIHAPGGYEGFAAIAAEILEAEGLDPATEVRVAEIEGALYWVTSGATYWPVA